jgi:Outer membrane lipoprotein Slp family
MHRRLVPLFAAPLLLSACALQPPALQGKFTPIGPTQATLPESLGQNVRWGGEVIGAREVGNETCLEVAAMRLADSSLRPVQPYRNDWGPAATRFLACNENGFGADLAKPGAIVTFTGLVTPPQMVDVQRERCADSGSYVNTLHAKNKQACLVALATVSVDDSYLWPYRALGNQIDPTAPDPSTQQYNR